jgi:Ca-activated chloride channel family protein
MGLVLGAIILVAGCRSVSPDLSAALAEPVEQARPRHRPEAPPIRAVRTGSITEALTPVEDEDRREIPMDQLLRQALAGAVEGSDADLGSRMQLRKILIPSPPRGANSRFNFDDGRRGWITALPSSQLLTSPAFGDGKIFLGGGFSSQSFFAFDAYTGEAQWSLRAPDGGPTAAIYDRNNIIFNTESCTLFVADAATGELRWSRWLGDPLMSQPASDGDRVFSAYPSGDGYRFSAFRMRDGEPLWTQPIPADAIQAPQVQGDSIYFATMDGTVHRMIRQTGRVVWSQDVGASSAVWVDGDGNVLLASRVDRGSTPHERMLVLSAATGVVRVRGDSFAAPYLAGGSRDRRMMSGQAGAWGSARSGERLGLDNVASGWSFQGSSPAVDNGRAYFAVGGEIQARDMSTGRTVWRRAYAEADGAQAVSPPAVVGSQIIFGTVDGHLYSADIDTGMTLWAYDLGEPIHFQPIVAQGWVYVATAQGNLIGLEMGDPAFDGWHMWGGNPGHAGLVETAGTVDPHLLASLERPGQGTMRRVGFEEPADGSETATDATPPGPEAAVEPEVDLPLTRTEFEASVSGVVAQVIVTQQFQNPYDRPIEAVYMFPLPEDAAVDDMEMRIGGRVIRGQIRRRAEARAVYTEARAAGRRAALLEQQRPNLFAQRVANIQPGERIDVRIRYVQMVPLTDDGYELSVPMVAPRRFDPEHPNPLAPAPDPLAPGEGEPPAVAAALPGLRSGSEVAFSLDLDAGLPIGNLSSPTHDIEIERRGDQGASVELAASDRIPNRDLIIRYDLSGSSPRAAVYTHRGEEGGYLTLVVQPPAAPAAEAVAARHFTFVLDRSSSMAGRPLEQARAMMDHLLSGLREGDTFNIYSFSDGLERLAEAPLPAEPSNVAQGELFIDRLSAVGATQMVPAIEAALAASAESSGEGLRIVVLITDGAIANEAEVLRTVAQGMGESRVYALGVGSSPNRFLLERTAELGRGRAIVAALSEPPVDVAVRFAAFVDRPVFTDVVVDWGGLAVDDVYPRRLPDLFAGRPLVLHGRFATGGTGTVRVRGTIGTRRYEQAIEVVLPADATDEALAVHGTLWARAAVRDRMNRLYLRDDDELIEEVADIGLRHRMVTQWTSFVAVDETPVERSDDDEGDEQGEEARATLSPARSLPGDPEIRIPAPEDALAVTVVLPFGETVEGEWEAELGLWTARFLIPRDAEEGVHPVRIIISHADGHQERLLLWYTVDSAAPLVEMEVEGVVRPGAEVVLRARQVMTEEDLHQAGLTREQMERTPRRAQILSDARRVQVAPPGQDVIDLVLAGPGTWEARWRVPDEARGTVELLVVVADIAANVRTQSFEVEVSR